MCKVIKNGVSFNDALFSLFRQALQKVVGRILHPYMLRCVVTEYYRIIRDWLNIIMNCVNQFLLSIPVKVRKVKLCQLTARVSSRLVQIRALPEKNK